MASCTLSCVCICTSVCARVCAFVRLCVFGSVNVCNYLRFCTCIRLCCSERYNKILHQVLIIAKKLLNQSIYFLFNYTFGLFGELSIEKYLIKRYILFYMKYKIILLKKAGYIYKFSIVVRMYIYNKIKNNTHAISHQRIFKKTNTFFWTSNLVYWEI